MAGAVSRNWAGALNPAEICPRCGPGRCDGTTQDCTLDSYYANPANPLPSCPKHGQYRPVNAAGCPGCYGIGVGPAQAPISAGTAQNPMMCPECGTFVGHVWHCSQFRLPTYPATQYDDAPPTERFPAPALAPRCECGSGSSVRSGAHSHWCPCWVAP